MKLTTIRRFLFGMVFIACMLVAEHTTAQRFAYVDTEYILSQMPEFGAAQKQMDVLAANWAKEIEEKQKDIDELYRGLSAEMALLTEEMRQQKEKEIKAKETELAGLQKKRFGADGDVFSKKKELLKPIQDKVYDAIQRLAKEKGYDFIFDNSGEFMMLYANNRFDKSDEVIEMMGIAKKAPANKDNKK